MVKFLCDGIIFDCDGVLLNSNALKTEAFRKILTAYPQDIVARFIDYHQTNGGISRYVKLRTFFTDFLATSVDETELTELLAAFGRCCRQLYQTAALTPGCLTVLEQLSSCIPLYVASGSDQTELQEVFAQRGLDKYFQEIYGSPKTKQECVAEIVAKFDSDSSLLMVGDAESDWQAATKAGINFIFMAGFSDAADLMRTKAQTADFPIIETLESLLPSLNLLVHN
ncbi:MAG: HAD hydrolase-like protein [Pleurocapsa sp.]